MSPHSIITTGVPATDPAIGSTPDPAAESVPAAVDPDPIGPPPWASAPSPPARGAGRRGARSVVLGEGLADPTEEHIIRGVN